MSKRTSKKLASVFASVLALILAFSLSACGSAPAGTGAEKKAEQSTTADKPAEKPAEAKEVTLDIFQFKVEFKDAFEKAANDFMAANKGVKIKIQTVGGGEDYGAALKAKFNSGEEPAIFNIGGPQDVQTWKSKIADITNTKIAQAALEGTLKGVTVDGKVFGAPYNIEGYGLIFNKTVFRKAGIDPASINSFAKLEEAVKTIDSKKKDLGLEAVFALPAKETWVTGLHMANMFFSPEFDGDVLKTFAAKNIEFKYADAFKKILDLQNKYSKQPTASLDYSTQVEKLFSTGKVAMIQQGNWAYGSIAGIDKKLAEESIGMLPYPVPGFKEDCYPVGVPMYWTINNGKPEEVKKVAADFLEWLYLSDAGKKIVVEQFKFIPAYKGYSNDSVSDPLGKQLLAAASAGKTINWVFMGFPDGWGMQKLGADIQNYVNGKMDWNKVVENAKKTWADARK